MRNVSLLDASVWTSYPCWCCFETQLLCVWSGTTNLCSRWSSKFIAQVSVHPEISTLCRCTRLQSLHKIGVTGHNWATCSNWLEVEPSIQKISRNHITWCHLGSSFQDRFETTNQHPMTTGQLFCPSLCVQSSRGGSALNGWLYIGRCSWFKTLRTTVAGCWMAEACSWNRYFMIFLKNEQSSCISTIFPTKRHPQGHSKSSARPLSNKTSRLAAHIIFAHGAVPQSPSMFTNLVRAWFAAIPEAVVGRHSQLAAICTAIATSASGHQPKRKHQPDRKWQDKSKKAREDLATASISALMFTAQSLSQININAGESKQISYSVPELFWELLQDTKFNGNQSTHNVFLFFLFQSFPQIVPAIVDWLRNRHRNFHPGHGIIQVHGCCNLLLSNHMNLWGIPERTFGCQQTPIFQGNKTVAWWVVRCSSASKLTVWGYARWMISHDAPWCSTIYHTKWDLHGSGSKPCTPGEHKNSW